MLTATRSAVLGSARCWEAANPPPPAPHAATKHHLIGAPWQGYWVTGRTQVSVPHMCRAVTGQSSGCSLASRHPPPWVRWGSAWGSH